MESLSIHFSLFNEISSCDIIIESDIDEAIHSLVQFVRKINKLFVLTKLFNV